MTEVKKAAGSDRKRELEDKIAATRLLMPYCMHHIRMSVSNRG